MRTKRILFTTAVHQNSSTLQKLFSQCDVKLLLRQSGLLIGQWQSGLLLVSAYHRYIYIYIYIQAQGLELQGFPLIMQ